MSTKSSLIFCTVEISCTAAHLYEECLAPDDFPAFLELSGVMEMQMQVTDHGNQVTEAIPRGLAKKLGLLPDAVRPQGC